MRKEMEAGRAREIRKAVEGVEEQLKSEFADSVAQVTDSSTAGFT